MGSSTVDYSKLTIVRCNPAQARETCVNHYPHWGQRAGFTLEGWTKRDDNLPEHAWVPGDRFATWALIDRSDPESLELLAHCETYRRNSLFVSPGASEPTEAYSYAVAAVFCPSKYRGTGYGRHLMRLLHYVLAPPEYLPRFPAEWGAPPAVQGFRDARFSVLYSVLGEKYYAECRKGAGTDSELGWVRQKATIRTWTVPEQSDETGDDKLGDGWTWMNPEDLKSLEPGAVREMRETIASKGDPTKTRLAVLPDQNLFFFQPYRDQLTVEHIGIPGGRDRRYGLIAPLNGPDDDRPFITWCFPRFSPPGATRTLLITYVRGPFPFAGVLAAARREGCGAIQQWGGDGTWDHEAGGVVLDEEANMPCVAQYGLGGDDKIDWQWCDRYLSV